MIGDNIKSLRKDKGLSQTELALMLDVKQPLISMFEGEKVKPNRRMVLALANIFKVSVIEIDPEFEFILKGG